MRRDYITLLNEARDELEVARDQAREVLDELDRSIDQLRDALDIAVVARSTLAVLAKESRS